MGHVHQVRLNRVGHDESGWKKPGIGPEMKDETEMEQGEKEQKHCGTKFHYVYTLIRPMRFGNWR